MLFWRLNENQSTISKYLNSWNKRVDSANWPYGELITVGGHLMNWLLATDLQRMMPRLSDQWISSCPLPYLGLPIFPPSPGVSSTQPRCMAAAWCRHHVQTRQHLVETKLWFLASLFKMEDNFSRSFLPSPNISLAWNDLIPTHVSTYHLRGAFMATTGDGLPRAGLLPEAHSYAEAGKNLDKTMLLGKRREMGLGGINSSCYHIFLI